MLQCDYEHIAYREEAYACQPLAIIDATYLLRYTSI